MYLVHLHLRPTGGSSIRVLPDRIEGGLRAAAGAEDGVEHVVVHRDARPYPVLGMYVVADRLEEAEANAARVWERARASYPELAGWATVEVRTPLIASFFDGIYEESSDGLPTPPAPPGRNRPGPFPATGTSFSVD